MNNEFPSAKVIAHSRAPSGEELITMEIELHRFILPEFNTHRSFSRNFQSSRAIPVEKMIEQVRNDPAMPVHWGKNQRGMVADEECNTLIDLGAAGVEFSPEAVWGFAAKQAADYAEAFKESGYHKQIVNRVLEPFMKTKGVVTATKDAYEAFFKLRCHKDAQPEIKLLAERMRDAIKESVPQDLKYGDYHTPYVKIKDMLWDNFEVGSHFDGGKVLQEVTEQAVKISASCCAQSSYRSLDDSLEKARKIYDMLNLPVEGVYPEDPPHFSPTEHIAKVVENTIYEVRAWDGYEGLCVDVSGNFQACEFWQYRKALELGYEKDFLTV